MNKLLLRKLGLLKPLSSAALQKGRFLIIKTSSLGDIIHAFSTLSYLKNRFPNAQIDWIVEKPFAELVRAHPLVHQTIPVNTREWRRTLLSSDTRLEIQSFERSMKQEQYDVIFDLQGNFKSGLLSRATTGNHRVGFGWKTVPEWPNVLFNHFHYNPPEGQNIRDDLLYLVKSYFQDETVTNEIPTLLNLSPLDQETIQQMVKEARAKAPLLFMICPGAFWPNKQLSLDSLIQFVKELLSYYPAKFFLISGNEAEKEICENLHAFFPESTFTIPKMALPMLQHLMKEMDVVIAMDSLPLHLAGTTGVSTFSLFGPSFADKYRPKGPQHAYYQGECPYGRKFTKRCTILRTCKTGACLRPAAGKVLFESFKAQLNLSFFKEPKQVDKLSLFHF